jgi:hypothetical protein
MPRFVSADPAPVIAPATYRETFMFHEAGHLFLAFYFGFEIGGLKLGHDGVDVIGAVVNRRGTGYDGLDQTMATSLEVQKVLAGELAARLRRGLNCDEIVACLKTPKAEEVNEDTSFESLQYDPKREQDDMYKVLWLMYSNKLTGNWWKWLWEQHQIAQALLTDNWACVERLAASLATTSPYKEGITYHPTVPALVATGYALIDKCRESTCPVRDKAMLSKAY